MIKVRVVSFVICALTLTNTSTPVLSQSLKKPNTVELREPIKLVQNTDIFDEWNKYTAVHETVQFGKVSELLKTAKGEKLEKVFEYLISASKQLAQHHKNQANSIESYIPIAQKKNGDIKFLKAMREFSLESSDYYELLNQYFSQLDVYNKSDNAVASRRLDETLGLSIKTKIKKVSADFTTLNNYYIANYASRQLFIPSISRIPVYNLGGDAIECALETYDCTSKYRYLHR